ncbi:MAG: hypothetical protein PHG67_09785 [Bacteroidales bacterium]|nr:hypothetical protein [Bacteroidales bacterium]
MITTTQKPKFGRLLWIENGTGREVLVTIGDFRFLGWQKSILKSDPQYANGTFKLVYWHKER